MGKQKKWAEDEKPHPKEKQDEEFKKNQEQLKKHRKEFDEEHEKEFEKADKMVKEKSSAVAGLIRVAFANPKLRPALLPVIKEAKKFEDAVKDKKFKHPDTGNDVKFKSLPADEQKKVRKKWKKKNKGDGDSGGGAKGWDAKPKSKKDVKKSLDYLKKNHNDSTTKNELESGMKNALGKGDAFKGMSDSEMKDTYKKVHKALGFDEKDMLGGDGPDAVDDVSKDDIKADLKDSFSSAPQDVWEKMDILADELNPEGFESLLGDFDDWVKNQS